MTLSLAVNGSTPGNADPLAAFDSSDRLGFHFLCAVHMDGDAAPLISIATAMETRAHQLSKGSSVQAQWGAQILREEAYRLRKAAREIGELA